MLFFSTAKPPRLSRKVYLVPECWEPQREFRFAGLRFNGLGSPRGGTCQPCKQFGKWLPRISLTARRLRVTPLHSGVRRRLLSK